MELLVDTAFDPAAGELSEDESKHCISVMRHRVGDEVYVCNGRGLLCRCVIVEAQKNKPCRLRVEAQETKPQPLHRLHMAVAPTKNTDRFEWFVEKAVELGVSEITPIICQHSERVNLRVDRLQRLVVAAAKQSLKFHLPIVNAPVKLSDLIASCNEAQRFILHCREGAKPHLFNATLQRTSTIVLIGPEGDIAKEEIALSERHEFKAATLGSERLRTETAAMAACHIVNLRNVIC